LCTIIILWIISNHSFIQINFTCVLLLIKDEKKKLNVLYYEKDYTLKCHKIIDEYWHYLICYKLSFNLLRNDIQFTCINKCAMWITFFWKFGIFFKNKKHHTQIALYITMHDSKIIMVHKLSIFNFKDIFIWSWNTSY
jgi:hypothetical protein